MSWKNRTGLFAGAVPIGIGLLTLFETWALPLGSSRNMGPGYFPTLLGILMILLGVGIIVVEGRQEDVNPPRVALRPLLAISLAIIAFALLVKRFGLAPAVMAATIISSAADRDMRPVGTLVYAIILALFTVVLFQYVLGLRVEAIRW